MQESKREICAFSVKLNVNDPGKINVGDIIATNDDFFPKGHLTRYGLVIDADPFPHIREETYEYSGSLAPMLPRYVKVKWFKKDGLLLPHNLIWVAKVRIVSKAKKECTTPK